MLSFSQTPLARYFCAVLIVSIALLATIQIELVATQTPFAFFFGAVTAASWLFGRGPGFVTELLSAVGAQFLLIPQLQTLQPDVSRTFQFGSFLLIGSIIVLATSSIRKYLSSADQDKFRFDSLFVHNPFPVWILDNETGRFLSVNKAAENAYGYSRDEFLSLRIDDISVTNDVLESTFTSVNAVQGSSPIPVSKHRKKDGSFIYVELTSHELPENGGYARLVHSVDVTERIRTSNALRTSEQRLATVFGSCPISITVNRWSDRTFVEINDEFTDLTGWDLKDIKGKTAAECGLVSAAVEAELGSYLLEHNTIVDREIEIKTRSGKIRNVLIGAVFVEMSGEQRVITSFVNVTELRRAEERHRASEERFRIVTEKARVGLVMINDRRRFSFVNSAYAELFELPSADIIGRRVSEIHSSLYEKQIGPSLDRAFAGQSFAYELRQATSEGMRYFDVRYEPTEIDGEVVAVVAVITETTDRTRAELAREKIEERYRTLFEYSPDGIAIADRNSRYIDANETLCRMLGYTREEFVGLHATNVFVPKEIPHLGETLFGLNADLEYYQDWQYRRKDGSTFPGEVIANIMPDGNTLTVIRDVSERKQLEDQLLQAQKMEAIGVLAGGVAHDFNNILTAISGYSDLTLQNMDADDPLRDYIVEISEAGDRAAALTSQLLSFSRRRVLSPSIVNLNSVVTDTGRMLKRIVKENIEFRTELDPKIGNVKVDSSQLTQIIVNLVVNAGDAMPNGGTLTISTRNTRLDGDYSYENVVVPSGLFVELTVRDTGVGMDESTRRRLFEPFFTTKEMGKGTGLGLSTVYGIVKQSGGDILVSSVPGIGSTFKVYLPAVMDISDQPSVRAPQIREPQQCETILLVEDEPAVRHLVYSILTQRGYKVIPVDSGLEALSVCHTVNGKIDLLLTDMIMPGMDGLQLKEAVQALRPEIKTLLMSGYTGDTLQNDIAIQADGGFIEKPFGPEELIAKIMTLLNAESNLSKIEQYATASTAS